jgi:hypothetical protein
MRHFVIRKFKEHLIEASTVGFVPQVEGLSKRVPIIPADVGHWRSGRKRIDFEFFGWLAIFVIVASACAAGAIGYFLSRHFDGNIFFSTFVAFLGTAILVERLGRIVMTNIVLNNWDWVETAIAEFKEEYPEGVPKRPL